MNVETKWPLTVCFLLCNQTLKRRMGFTASDILSILSVKLELETRRPPTVLSVINVLLKLCIFFILWKVKAIVCNSFAI